MSWLSFSVTLIILTIILKKNYETFENSDCYQVSENNPYGNFTLYDQHTNPNRPAVCPTPLEESERKMASDFNGILPNDHYNKHINFRDFYTMPVTTNINNQTDFAKFLMGTSGECKHDGKNCLKDENTRFHRGRYFDGNRN